MSSDTTAVLAQHDPKFLRARRRERWAIVGVAILAVAGVIAAGISIAKIVQTEKRVTKVEHSACAQATEHPNDVAAFRECSLIRASTNRREPIRNPCISYERVTGEKGRNCPQKFTAKPPEVTVTPVAPASADTGTAPAEGGGAIQSPPTGTQQPGPQGGGAQHGGGQTGGSEPEPPDPPSDTEPSASAPAPIASEAPAEPEQTPPPSFPESTPSEPAPEHPIASAVGGLVEETGEAANGVLCGVTGALNLNC